MSTLNPESPGTNSPPVDNGGASQKSDLKMSMLNPESPGTNSPSVVTEMVESQLQTSNRSDRHQRSPKCVSVLEFHGSIRSHPLASGHLEVAGDEEGARHVETPPNVAIERSPSCIKVPEFHNTVRTHISTAERMQVAENPKPPSPVLLARSPNSVDVSEFHDTIRAHHRSASRRTKVVENSNSQIQTPLSKASPTISPYCVNVPEFHQTIRDHLPSPGRIKAAENFNTQSQTSPLNVSPAKSPNCVDVPEFHDTIRAHLPIPGRYKMVAENLTSQLQTPPLHSLPARSANCVNVSEFYDSIQIHLPTAAHIEHNTPPRRVSPARNQSPSCLSITEFYNTIREHSMKAFYIVPPRTPPPKTPSTSPARTQSPNCLTISEFHNVIQPHKDCQNASQAQGPKLIGHLTPKRKMYCRELVHKKMEPLPQPQLQSFQPAGRENIEMFHANPDRLYCLESTPKKMEPVPQPQLQSAVKLHPAGRENIEIFYAKPDQLTRDKGREMEALECNNLSQLNVKEFHHVIKSHMLQSKKSETPTHRKRADCKPSLSPNLVTVTELHRSVSFQQDRDQTYAMTNSKENLSKTVKAVIRIQALFRGRRGIGVYHELQIRHRAAFRIQMAFCTFLAQKSWQLGLRADRASKTYHDLQVRHCAAEKIQNAYREYLINRFCKDLRIKRCWASNLVAVGHSKKEKINMLFNLQLQHMAAAYIQAFYQDYKKRQALRTPEELEFATSASVQKWAAMLIQTVFREYRARLKNRHIAATMIQAFYRAHRAIMMSESLRLGSSVSLEKELPRHHSGNSDNSELRESIRSLQQKVNELRTDLKLESASIKKELNKLPDQSPDFLRFLLCFFVAGIALLLFFICWATLVQI